MKLNIVMVEPEIPQNTGNIARTCAIIIEYHDSLDAFLNKYKPEENNMFYATTKGQHCYSDVDYKAFGDKEIYILFGKESKGLPEDLLQKYIENTIRIPMRPVLRSLNLANSVAIIAYEVFRQFDFDGLQEISDYFGD